MNKRTLIILSLLLINNTLLHTQNTETSYNYLFEKDTWYTGWGITRKFPLFWLLHNRWICSNCAKRATLFKKSAQKGDTLLCEKCLAKNVRVNQKYENGDTALHYATQYGHEEIVKLLFANQQDINWFKRWSRVLLMRSNDKIINVRLFM